LLNILLNIFIEIIYWNTDNFIKVSFPTVGSYGIQHRAFFSTKEPGINQKEESFLAKYDIEKEYIETFVDVVYDEHKVAVDIKGIYGRTCKIMWGLKENALVEIPIDKDKILKKCDAY
jgi:hypothetical protein